MTISYMEALSESYPDVGAVCHGDPFNYNDIIFDNTIVSKEDLDIAGLNLHKKYKVAEILKICQDIVYAGFMSDALVEGVYRHYDGNVEDQMNIVGGTVAAMGLGFFPFPSRDAVTNELAYINHTPEQMMKMTSQGAYFKLLTYQRYIELSNYINILTLIEDIDAVNWNTVIPS